MKPCLLALTLIAGCVTSATPAIAQSGLPHASAVSAPKPKAADEAKTVAAVAVPVADTRAAVRTPRTTMVIAAAGSIIILADGIVANAALAQILPPAPGFVYEH